MSRRALWRTSISTTAEAEDAVSELAARVLGHPASAYRDFERNRTTVSVYAGERPGPQQRAALQSGLSHLKSCGLMAGSAKLSFQRVPRENWAESWKRHFKPIEIGGRLLIKPSWSQRRPGAGQAVVVLDPGLSFGTGQHPTTAFCLQALVQQRTHGAIQSFLDIGTGSGILAIAAVKLGFSPVHAFDVDPEAVRIARANARANGVFRKLRIAPADLARLRSGRCYDLICANLISALLVRESKRIVTRLKPGGMLAVAGVLASEFRQARKAFERAGLRLVRSRREKEWQSGTFIHRG